MPTHRPPVTDLPALLNAIHVFTAGRDDRALLGRILDASAEMVYPCREAMAGDLGLSRAGFRSQARWLTLSDRPAVLKFLMRLRARIVRRLSDAAPAALAA